MERKDRQSFIAHKQTNNNVGTSDGIITDMVHWVWIKAVNAEDTVAAFCSIRTPDVHLNK